LKLLIKLALLAVAIYYLPKYCHSKTDGFALTKIHSNLSYNSDWETSAPPKEMLEMLDDIFNQTFTYLSSGGQAYVFVSEDGKYVLKFFKHHLRRLPFLLKHLPLPKNLAAKREKKRAGRIKKLHRDFNSYKLAFESLSEETGLLFVHLNKTDHLKKHLRIIDKLNIEHLLDLDQLEFILQKKATLAFTYLRNLINQGENEAAKKAIESICTLILNRCKMGIYDEDAKIHRNFGFIDNRAVLIDVGRLKYDERRKEVDVQKADLRKITQQLDRFLYEISPELAIALEKRVDG